MIKEKFFRYLRKTNISDHNVKMRICTKTRKIVNNAETHLSRQCIHKKLKIYASFIQHEYRFIWDQLWLFSSDRLEITVKNDWKKLTRHLQKMKDRDLTLQARISKNYVIFIISNKKNVHFFPIPNFLTKFVKKKQFNKDK